MYGVFECVSNYHCLYCTRLQTSVETNPTRFHLLVSFIFHHDLYHDIIIQSIPLSLYELRDFLIIGSWACACVVLSVSSPIQFIVVFFWMDLFHYLLHRRRRREHHRHFGWELKKKKKKKKKKKLSLPRWELYLINLEKVAVSTHR
jgi:hypothetical protein